MVVATLYLKLNIKKLKWSKKMKQYKKVKILVGNEIEKKLNCMYEDKKITVGNIHFQTCNNNLFALVEYSYDIAE